VLLHDLFRVSEVIFFKLEGDFFGNS